MDTTKTEQTPRDQRKAGKRLKLDLPPKCHPRQWVHATGTPGSVQLRFTLWIGS